jgi:hypothetical protein
VAIFVVTGKLGGGKTLGAVSKINEALGKGRRVATNLDLRLDKLPSVGKRAKNCRVVRVPDQPQVDDLQAIGFGIEGVSNLDEARRAYDEDRFGLLVLDECGTWLNSRDWAEHGRRELINYLLHIRKHLWDVYLIIQDVSMLDKQARKALAEHVVYCRRFDRISLPGISFLSEHLLGKRYSMPKLHMGIVKYGDQPNSMTVGRWWYNGLDLYAAYDTTQVFISDYQTGLYSLLPPFYYHSNALTKWNWVKRLRLTRIYLRKWSNAVLLGAGVFAGALVAAAWAPDQIVHTPVEVATAEPAFDFASGGSSAHSAPPVVPLINRLSFGTEYGDGSSYDLTFKSDAGRLFRVVELASQGITIRKTGSCRWRLDDESEKITRIVTCYG